MAETTDVGAASLLTDEGPTAARLSFKLPHDTVRDEPPLRPGDGPGTPAKPESGGSSAPRSDSGVVLRSTADAPAEGAAAADKAADDDEPPTILRRAIGTSAAEAERTLVEINKNPERPSPPPRAPDLEMPTPAQPLSYEAAVRSLGAIVDTDPEDQTEVETLRVSGPQMPLAPIEAAMLSPPPAKLPTAPAAAASAAAPPAAAMPPAAAKVIAAALAPPGARAAATASMSSSNSSFDDAKP